MTDPVPVKLTETCRCGASTSVEAPDRVARGHVDRWRSIHPCTNRDDEDHRGRTGSSTILAGGPAAARVGFGAAPEVRGPVRWGRLHDADDVAGRGKP